MPHLLNWFPIDIAPDVLTFPTTYFSSFEETTQAFRSSLRLYRCYRGSPEKVGQQGESRIPVALLRGPEPPENLENREFAVLDNPGLISRLIAQGLRAPLAEQGAQVYEDGFSFHARWPAEEHAIGLRLYTGIRAKVHQPGVREQYGLVVNWNVSAEFTRSLADDELRALCFDCPLVLRFTDNPEGVPKELRRYRNRFVGRVIEKPVSWNAVRVLTRDGSIVDLPPEFLYLEATSASIRMLEHNRALSSAAQSVARRMQELSFVLTDQGRRNLAVFQKRMSAIRERLSPGRAETLRLRIDTYSPAVATVHLQPVRLTEGK